MATKSFPNNFTLRENISTVVMMEFPFKAHTEFSENEFLPVVQSALMGNSF